MGMISYLQISNNHKNGLFKKMYSYLYLYKIYKINQSGKFTIHCTVVDCIECTLHFSLSYKETTTGF